MQDVRSLKKTLKCKEDKTTYVKTQIVKKIKVQLPNHRKEAPVREQNTPPVVFMYHEERIILYTKID